MQAQKRKNARAQRKLKRIARANIRATASALDKISRQLPAGFDYNLKFKMPSPKLKKQLFGLATALALDEVGGFSKEKKAWIQKLQQIIADTRNIDTPKKEEWLRRRLETDLGEKNEDFQTAFSKHLFSLLQDYGEQKRKILEQN